MPAHDNGAAFPLEAPSLPTGPPRPGGSALPSPVVRIARRQHRARRRQVAGVVVVAQQLAVERVVVAVEQVLDAQAQLVVGVMRYWLTRSTVV